MSTCMTSLTKGAGFANLLLHNAQPVVHTGSSEGRPDCLESECASNPDMWKSSPLVCGSLLFSSVQACVSAGTVHFTASCVESLEASPTSSAVTVKTMNDHLVAHARAMAKEGVSKEARRASGVFTTLLARIKMLVQERGGHAITLEVRAHGRAWWSHSQGARLGMRVRACACDEVSGPIPGSSC